MHNAQARTVVADFLHIHSLGGKLSISLIAITRTVHLPRFDWSVLAIKNGINYRVLVVSF